MSTTLESLVAIRAYRTIAKELLDLEHARGVFDLPSLSRDPESSVASSTELEIEYDTNPAQGCSVFGYYRYRSNAPSVIVIHPSLTVGRDTFTLLHEFGHHVQRQHAQWAALRYDLHPAIGQKLEERIADAIAAELLLPTDLDLGVLEPGRLVEVHSTSRASRSAIAMRAIEVAGEVSAVVIVVDMKGEVIFARSAGDDIFPPARGRIQPDLAALFERATNDAAGRATAELVGGLQAQSGWSQTDVKASLAIDASGEYAFVVVSPLQRFGRQPTWERSEYECASAACGSTFSGDASLSFCNECSAPRCPDCSQCACAPRLGRVCGKCFEAMSLAEQSGQVEHVC